MAMTLMSDCVSLPMLFVHCIFCFLSRKMFTKVDKDGDGLVTEEELIEWIQNTQNKYIMDDVEKQ